MSLLVILVAVLAFIAVAGFGMVFAGGNNNDRVVKRAQAIGASSRIEKSARVAKPGADPTARRKQLLQNLKEQERRQRKASLTLAARLQQGGLSISVRTFWIISAVFGLCTGVIPLVLHQALWMALAAAVVAGLGLPRWVVGFLANKRKKAFTEHFPDAIDIIVRGIKSGLPVHDCLRIISHESSPPLGPEFQRLVENLAMGVTMDQALEQMFQRMPTPELRFFTIVLAIQSKTGGNLAEALANLSQVLRGRKLMREKIKALSSEAKASAWIIGSLPPAVILMISVTSPNYMAVMVTDPRGHMLILISIVVMGMGILVMRNMINFKF